VANAPARTRRVYFAGAGLSCALGLPNTAELIDGVFRLAEAHDAWGVTQGLPDRLRKAFAFLYPDGHYADYRPDIVDFFSALSTYVDIGEGLAGTGLQGARDLYEQLQFAIGHLLVEKTREVDEHLEAGHRYLDEMVKSGNIIITSNWDCVIERYAQLKHVPLRHSGYDERDCVLLKLHGSIDWLQVRDRPRHRNNVPRYTDGEYCVIGERLFGDRPYTKPLPRDPSELIRVRAIENINTAWRQIKSRSDRPYMITMGTGKGSRLGQLEPVWTDAYNALSRAKELELVGYSMPTDDIEIRTLLRAGLQRGAPNNANSDVTVRNPSPDVHHRIRTLLDREIKSDYRPVDGIR
jgi:hypothetical protein